MAQSPSQHIHISRLLAEWKILQNKAPKSHEILMFVVSKKTFKNAVMSQSLAVLIVLVDDATKLGGTHCAGG